MVKRYDIGYECTLDNSGASMEEAKDGEYVKCEDYKILEDRWKAAMGLEDEE